MPEADPTPTTTSTKQYFEDVPVATPGFFLKGAASLDWGMKNRLARIFRPATGRTVMLAVDHGYFQGPTTGLERLDLALPPLLPHADALMATRGAIRTTVGADLTTPVVVRASGGPSVLRELSDENVAMSIDDAVRLNASMLAVQVFVGSEHETQSVRNLTTLVDAGQQRRHPGDGRGGRRQGDGARRPLLPVGHPHDGRAGRPGGQVLPRRRGLRHRGRLVPGAPGGGRRQEAARARGPGDDAPLRRRRAPSGWTWAATSSSPTPRRP